MNGKSIIRMMVASFFCWAFLSFNMAGAQDILRYSCSAQIFEAFEMERLKAFTHETGIKVDLYTSSSAAAVYRLMNDFSDIAGAAEELRFSYKEFGYSEVPFCKDSLAVIVNRQCPVENLTKKQLQDIFFGYTKNWKELGGLDLPIIIVIPEQNTAAYKNFRRLAMDGREMVFNYMSYRSTMVIDAVQHIPWAISFAAHAAVKHNEHLKIITIDEQVPGDSDYPYYQTFYYVTRGEPVGAVKRFIDFTFSKKGQALIREKGMIPLLEK